MGMRNDGQKSGDRSLVTRSGRVNTGLIPHSFKTLSRIVSSGASSVASTVRSAASAASAVMERDVETHNEQVVWAGFDKLELERGVTRHVLLLGFNHGFQVWDVEAADKVCNIASRSDCAVSFMQMQPAPLISTKSEDKFAHSRPLLIICADASVSEDNSCIQGGTVAPCNGSIGHYNGINGSHAPTVVWFYSLKSQSYIHLLRFRSVVHLVRCSSRIVCVLQSAQIHCLNAATLEREYTILTNMVTPGYCRSVNMGLGPLAVGPRWMAYSGSLVVMTNSGRVSPQHLAPPCNFPPSALNGSLVAHYAKETSRQIAAGIATLGDIGCKKLLRYYSGFLPDVKDLQSGTSFAKINGVSGGPPADSDNVGMVIVRDVVKKTVLAQFRAHSSPISALCFDSSGTLLVTASVKGHNINVFRIMPGQSEDSTGTPRPSHIHLYSLQRGFTDAVIQDISFSSDSQWIMVSTSRGTSHLFPISPSGGMVSFQSSNASTDRRGSGTCTMAKPAIRGASNSGLQVLTTQNLCESSSPITLSAVSRIRTGSDGWRSTVSEAAAAATGRLNSFSGAIASVFHKCKGSEVECEINSLKKNYYLLVFSPSGCVIQYALLFASACDDIFPSPGVTNANEPSLSSDGKLMVEAIQKWNIFQKQNRKDQGVGNVDMYGEIDSCFNGSVYSSKKHDNHLPFNSYGLNTEGKVTTEEKHHMYISEVELQMHQNNNPLWSRSEIYFQLLLTDGSDEAEEASSGGEIEIEKLPIRTLEARSKELIPVYNYLHTSKFHQGRAPIRNGSKQSEPFKPNRLDMYGSHKLSQGLSRSSSLNSTSNGYLDNHAVDNVSSQIGPNSGSDVNSTNGNPESETVNTREDSGMDSQLTSVHNKHSPDIETKFREDNEFD